MHHDTDEAMYVREGVGFEDFWREVGTPVADAPEPPPPTPPDPARMEELGRRYAIEFFG